MTVGQRRANGEIGYLMVNSPSVRERSLADASEGRVWKWLAFLLILVSAPMFGMAQENVTLDRTIFVASPKWHLLRRQAVRENALLFRKYAFPVIDDIEYVEFKDIKNMMSYGCQRNSRFVDYLAFHLPSWIELIGVDRNGWIPKLDLNIAIDRVGFTAAGEYRNRELFIDLTNDFRDHILKLLISEKIFVAFGPKNERITVYQSHRTPSGGNVVGFFDDAVPMLSQVLHGGKVESLETESILERCSAFKRNGRY